MPARFPVSRSGAAGGVRAPSVEQQVRRTRGILARHRTVFEVFQLSLVEHPDLLVVMQVPASNNDLERVASLLAPVTALNQRILMIADTLGVPLASSANSM